MLKLNAVCRCSRSNFSLCSWKRAHVSSLSCFFLLLIPSGVEQFDDKFLRASTSFVAEKYIQLWNVNNDKDRDDDDDDDELLDKKELDWDTVWGMWTLSWQWQCPQKWWSGDGNKNIQYAETQSQVTIQCVSEALTAITIHIHLMGKHERGFASSERMLNTRSRDNSAVIICKRYVKIFFS